MNEAGRTPPADPQPGQPVPPTTGAAASSKPGDRPQIGLVDTSARKSDEVVARLSKPQQALREAAINHFKSNKLKAYIAEQLEYVNSAQQIGEGIRFLFDRDSRAPANMPLEEVIAERKRIEVHIAWLEALVAELRNNLVLITKIEDDALDLLESELDDA